MQYLIMGVYGNRAPEIIDTAKTQKQANFLLAEYKLAFGAGWLIYIDRGNNAKK